MFEKFRADAMAAASKFGDSTKELGIKAGKIASETAEVASVSVTEGARKGAAIAQVAANATGRGLSAGADIAKRSAHTVVTTVFDQNDDGKLDQEDLKMITKSLVESGKSAIKEIGMSDLVKKTSAGAVVGGAIASVVPGIGTATGAVLGAGGAAYKHFTEK